MLSQGGKSTHIHNSCSLLCVSYTMDRIPEFSIDAISQMSSRHQFSTPPSSLGGQGTTTSAPFSQHQETTEGPTYNPNFWNPVFRRLNETLISNVLPMDRKVVSVAPNASITGACLFCA
jgi:hypothetical protein